MAQFDVVSDTTPKLQNRPRRGPSISDLKAAITGSGVAASYPASRMDAMTKDDLIFVCKTHNITVAGL